ncbi:DUF2905 domain-containing protein [Alkalihalobacillus trypoxylicola]|uniref:DUF2905 domain-containing protein n=1 Tax=Alkalihalobacillus trypoxylicola TaxID=519424 RepID=A0A161PGG0_9BACI|nr:DUF2905 domain-containing protein [Alkalihalobacillus trypoxylicola]KYG31864.1 hypothetical protein AZF04_03545 [Alkalihalobacillus trypoxylicola]
MGFFPKLLITLGVILIILGIVWQVIGRFIPLGKLPGDILIKGENSTFYFPIVTCLVISVLLSLIFFILGRFR